MAWGQRFFTNIICGFVPGEARRRRVRAMLNSPMRKYINFIRENTDFKITKLKTFTGFRAHNIVISVNDKFIYKFAWRDEHPNETAMRELRITDALRDVSPIPMPNVQIMKCDGLIVRRYDFIDGLSLRQMSPDFLLNNLDNLAQQIANFVYQIAISDPADIRDLKPTKNAQPGYMYGWFHGDLWDNFFVNPDTMQIIAFIDWEDAAFRDFAQFFKYTRRHTPHAIALIEATKREYDKLYKKMMQKEKKMI